MYLIRDPKDWRSVEDILRPYQEGGTGGPCLPLRKFAPNQWNFKLEKLLKEHYAEEAAEFLSDSKKNGLDSAWEKHRGIIQNCLRDWAGWIIGLDGFVYTVDNPNGKWDWFVVGGRWADSLHLIDEQDADGNQATTSEAVIGEVDWINTERPFAICYQGLWYDRDKTPLEYTEVWKRLPEAPAEYEVYVIDYHS